MKQIITLALAALVMLGCSKDDGVGSYSISGTPNITSIEAGYKRVIATWEINTTSSDASLTNIYWNGGDNSTGQYLSATEGNTVTIEITDLTEGEHTFYVQNATPTSNQYSAPSASVSIYVYGDSYCKDLAQRTIASIDYLDGDDVEAGAYVTWSSFTNSDGAIGNMLYYRNQSNVETELFCSIDDDKSLVADAIVETEVSYSTLYKPSGCLDTLATSSVSGQEFPMSNDGIIRVASILAMQPYFAMDDVHVLLEKGDYVINAANIMNDDFTAKGPNVSSDDSGNVTLVESAQTSFFLIAGDNSTYDFGGSTITTYTAAYQYLNGDCTPLRFTGNNNTVKNIEMIDDGELETKLTGITNVIIDGANNTLEEMTLRSVGSYPYGYGELFGKGGGSTISHQKHCGVLVRGDYNHVLNCNIYHRAYGHCLFMQGAVYPTIEGCYIESEMSTTEAVYAEKGTGSAADNINFLTYFGFHMTENYLYTLALCEAGIRAYDSGNTVVNGVGYSRGKAQSPTVIDCYIKNTRVGVTLTHATGTSTVRNCTTIGTSRGFAVNDGTVIEKCYSDAQYGPAYGVDYTSGNKNTVDITIVDQESAEWIEVDGVEYRTSSGCGHLAYIQGSGHSLKFRDGRVNDTSNSIYTTVATMTKNAVTFARFDLGGDKRGMGEIWMTDVSSEILDSNGDGTGEFSQANPSETISDDNMALTNSNFANETDYPVYIDANVTNCNIYSNGLVILEPGASGNKIYIGPEGSLVVAGVNELNTIVYGEWDIDTCF